MESKWLKVGKICLIVLGVLLFLFLIGFGRSFLPVWEINKITMKACDGEGTKIVELTDGEAFGFAALYTFSRYAGPVTAEGCSHKYDIDVHMKDGTTLSVMEHQGKDNLGDRMKVYGSNSDSIWLDNIILVGYIRLLVATHGLEWDTFSDCC